MKHLTLFVFCSIFSTTCFAFDFETYEKQRGSGKVTFTAVEDKIHVVSQRFDPHTGEALEPDRDFVDEGALLSEKARLEIRLSHIDGLLRDLAKNK